MAKVMRFVLFMALWISACVVFDGWLKLRGPWMMLAGALTGLIADGLGLLPGRRVPAAEDGGR